MTAESLSADDAPLDLRSLLGAVISRWFRIVVVTMVLVGAAYAVLYFVPKLYESSASILVETRDNAFSGPATGASSGNGGAAITIDSVISSQIELIKSRDTLMSVIDELNLRSETEFNGAGVSPIGLLLSLLGRKPEVKSVDEVVLANLLERMTVIRERDSAIVSIFVRSTNPELAASIANAVAAAHVKRRGDLSLSDTTEASQWLEAEIVKLRQRVQDAEQAVADFRIANDLIAGTSGTSLVDQQLSGISSQITAATERRNTAQTRAALIRGLIERGQPIDGIADVQNSVTLQQLSQSKAELQRQLAERSSTLLRNHPTIRALRAQIGEIEDQIASEGRRVATALETEAQIEADLVTSLQAELAKLKVSASGQTLNTVTLDGLEREATAQRQLLESYLLRYSEALSRSESSSTLPDVRVVTAAAPSSSPASPKTTFILGAVAFIALALQIGGIIFSELLSGRALAMPARSAETEVEVEEAPAGSAQDVFEPMLPFDAREVEPEVAVAAPAAEKLEEDTEAESDIEDRLVEPAISEVPSVSEVEHVTEPEPGSAEPPPLAPLRYEPDLVSISGDLALGRVRVVLIASIGPARDVSPVAEALISDALGNGLTVAHVDAGSGRPTFAAGITDLAAEKSSFGDVVHKDLRLNRADVPWGTMATLDRRSTKPMTLIAALGDLYEVVIVSTGRIGMASSLPLFAGADARLVLVAPPRMDPELVSAALGDAEDLGFSAPEIVAAPLSVEVA